MQPYLEAEGIGQGNVYAEKECLAMVAGILMLWKFKPVGESAEDGKWKLPSSTRPDRSLKVGTRVRITKRGIS